MLGAIISFRPPLTESSFPQLFPQLLMYSTLIVKKNKKYYIAELQLIKALG